MRSMIPSALFFLLVFLAPAWAQAPDSDGGAALPPREFVPPTPEMLAAIEGPARLAVYFDLVAQSSSRAVDPGESFEFHVVAVGAEGGLRGWESQILLDERIAVVSRRLEGLNMGPGQEIFQVGLGSRCLTDQRILLVSYSARLREAEASELTDVWIRLAPVPRGSFDPPAPGYVSCNEALSLNPFEWPETAAVINPLKLQPSRDEATEEKPRFDMHSGRGDSR